MRSPLRTARKVLLALPLLLVAVFAPGGPALAFERDGYAMEILVDGIPLAEYAARGTRYVEALKGREYSIRLSNRTGGRVAIALSVDGLNSIDARTTSASEARKWVLDPYETITLDGWQTSSSTARRFVFTTEKNSYGDWLGRTANLGVVAAAVFRERRPFPMAVAPQDRQSPEGWPAPSPRSEDAQGTPRSQEDGTARQDDAERERDLAGEQGSRSQKRSKDDLAATGIGRETEHRVHQVYLDLEESPAARMEVRYEYRDALVRLGVLPADGLYVDPLVRREKARGFTDPGFAPDPYGRRR
jgi:hypothetical protein